MTGVGMLAVAISARPVPAIFPAAAIIVIFAGAGLLVAAFVAYQLSKRWRLLDVNGGRSSTEQTD
jgi:hypothetical protein